MVVVTSLNHVVASEEAQEAKGTIRTDLMDVRIALVIEAWDLHKKTWACRIQIINP